MEKYPKTVSLKNGKNIILSMLKKDDLEPLITFFQSLPQKDRMFLRIDVMKKHNILRRYGHFNYDIMFPVIASCKGELIGIGTLWRAEFGWMRNLGEIRCVVATEYQRQGLCTILVRELFLYALTTSLSKIQAEIMEDQKSALAAFERMGFKREAVLKKHVTDINGDRRNLVIMSLDIVELWDLMEDHTIGNTYVV
jgi:RimJ/RimL family protein N-acetyltransferase